MPVRNRKPKICAEQISWLRRAGVTHVLAFEPLDAAWPVRLVWEGVDPLLNPAWARLQPLLLYELKGSRGRVAWESAAAGQVVRVTDDQPTRVAIEAHSPAGGRLILTDLHYPGWTVTVDGAVAEAQVVDGMFRGVTLTGGTHDVVWSYSPRDVYWGLFVSATAWVALAILALTLLMRLGDRQNLQPDELEP